MILGIVAVGVAYGWPAAAVRPFAAGCAAALATVVLLARRR
jgi:hypothetical protein